MLKPFDPRAPKAGLRIFLLALLCAGCLPARAEPPTGGAAAGADSPATSAPGEPAPTPRHRRSVMAMRTLVKNARAGLAFQQANAKESGVVKLPSGLQYQVLKTGTGTKPKAKDSVAVLYDGRLIDGTVFVQTVSADKPATLKIAEQVPGLQEALTMMTVGSKWQITIPPKLAFGAAGSPPDIGPEATLVYELELVAVKPRKPSKKS